MLKLSLIGTIAACLLLTGCAGEHGLGCGDSQRYANSRSDAPLRVPDDLSVPDESDSLSVPSSRAGNAAPAADRCLETPPPFSERGAPAAPRS
jgi:hypothetical protein